MNEFEHLKIKGIAINNLLHGLNEDSVIIEDWTSNDYDAVFKKKLELKERIKELEEDINYLKNYSEKIDKIMTLRFEYKK